MKRYWVIFLISVFGVSDYLEAGVVVGDVMFMGDSITQGKYGSFSGSQSYRYPLWKKLVDGGDTFDFVGSHSHNYDTSTSTTTVSLYPDYSGEQFDTDHEGHWGWSSTDVLGTTTPTRTPGTGTGELSNWLTGYTPDTVFMLLGVNDIRYSTGASVATTKSNVVTIIDAIIADNPTVDIYMGSVLPATSSFVDANKVTGLNVEYQDIAANSASVTYVDLHSKINVATHLYDGIHPNATGEEIIATAFYEAILELEPEPVVKGINVVNHSFEAQQGTWNNGAPTGWVESSGFTSRGNFNPTTFIPGGFYADTPSGMDGVMSAFMLRNPDLGYFEQTLLGADGLVGGGDDPVLTADTTYTVTVAIGRRDGSRPDSDGPEDFAGFIIELFAGTTVAGSATVVAGSYLPGSVAGDFTDYTFNFTTDATSAGLGEALKIRIGRETSGDPLYLDFDNVRIDGTVIPEPATLGMVVVSGCGMLFLRRKFMI